jgi:hypothetical protein|tara:strand:- start:329 stop:535 length:207 start_codon:yes stop_codon:yes gene_type:complete
MRSVLAPGGIPTFVNKLEHKVYESCNETVYKVDLSERDAYIMQSLVNKNLVKKVVEGKKVYYTKTRSM